MNEFKINCVTDNNNKKTTFKDSNKRINVIFNNNNIGIGITNPGSKLHEVVIQGLMENLML